MEFYVQFVNGKPVPEYNSDYDKLAKIKPLTTYKIAITQPRNIGFHKKYFALLNLCYENQETFNNIDDMREWLTLKAGYFRRVQTPTGTIFKADSISFAKMDELSFGEYYNRVMDQICKWLDLNDEDVRNEIVNYM